MGGKGSIYAPLSLETFSGSHSRNYISSLNQYDLSNGTMGAAHSEKTALAL